MADWRYHRERFYSRRAAVADMDPALLNDPLVAHALNQIAIAEAALDNLLEHHGEEGDD